MKEIEEIKEYLKNRLKSVQKGLDDMIDQKLGIINISGLTKKEQQEITNKRNCLVVQKYCYNEILDKIMEE